jgi:uncharacterized protein
MRHSMHVIGIDLSGPRNIADTAAAALRVEANGLRLGQGIPAVSDRALFDLVSESGQTGNVTVGIDAPLSYNPGGGDRPSDRDLRRRVQPAGRVGIMPPTLIRMVYLTLRGIALSRALETLKPRVDLRVVEVHPGAAMLLRGAPSADVAAFKRDTAARLRLLDWLRTKGLSDLPRSEQPSDHFVAACAAALAAWQWSLGRPTWCASARPPEHPYDFACGARLTTPRSGAPRWGRDP